MYNIYIYIYIYMYNIYTCIYIYKYMCTNTTEKLHQQQLMMELENLKPKSGTSGSHTPAVTAAKNSKNAKIKCVPSGAYKQSAANAFEDVLAVNTADAAHEGSFGPRDGMYEFNRLNEKTITQTVEYLEVMLAACGACFIFLLFFGFPPRFWWAKTVTPTE